MDIDPSVFLEGLSIKGIQRFECISLKKLHTALPVNFTGSMLKSPII